MFSPSNLLRIISTLQVSWVTLWGGLGVGGQEVGGYGGWSQISKNGNMKIFDFKVYYIIKWNSY